MHPVYNTNALHVERLQQAGVPAAPVNDVGQVADHEQTAALGLVQLLSRRLVAHCWPRPQRFQHEFVIGALGLVVAGSRVAKVEASGTVTINGEQAAGQEPSQVPDLEGEFRGAARQKQGSVTYERVSPEHPLPRRLIAQLGQSLRVGDLEVTPQNLRLRKKHLSKLNRVRNQRT